MIFLPCSPIIITAFMKFLSLVGKLPFPVKRYGLSDGSRRSGLHRSGRTASLSVFRRRGLRDRNDLFQRRISAFIGPVCRQPHFHIRAGATAAFLHGQRSYGIPGISALSADPDAHREFRFDQYSEHFERCYLEELLLMLMRHSVMNEKDRIC